MMLARAPIAMLAPFVRRIWVVEGSGDPAGRELVLPTGLMHLAIRLCDAPLRVVEEGAERVYKAGVIGGARAGSYVRDIAQPVLAVGAELRPGTARLLFGAPADALAHAHTSLADCWSPREIESVRDQIASAPTPEAQLGAFEAVLCARLPRVRALHPAIAEALTKFPHCEVHALVRESGYSHRGFNNLFSEAVGMTPKLFARVLRFERALARVHGADEASLVALALASGYSDQAHFNRDFRTFAGLSPSEYRARSPALAHHVPLR